MEIFEFTAKNVITMSVWCGGLFSLLFCGKTIIVRSFLFIHSFIHLWWCWWWWLWSVSLLDFDYNTSSIRPFACLSRHLFAHALAFLACQIIIEWSTAITNNKNNIIIMFVMKIVVVGDGYGTIIIMIKIIHAFTAIGTVATFLSSTIRNSITWIIGSIWIDGRIANSPFDSWCDSDAICRWPSLLNVPFNVSNTMTSVENFNRQQNIAFWLK